MKTFTLQLVHDGIWSKNVELEHVSLLLHLALMPDLPDLASFAGLSSDLVLRS